MYLFSLWNNFDKNTIVFIKDLKVYSMEMLWGQTSNEPSEIEDSFDLIIELKTTTTKLKKYLKYKEFVKKVHAEIEPFLENFLMTIQTQCFIQVVYESDEINAKIICFRVHSGLDAKELGNSSRQGIESERCMMQFLYGCPEKIFLENISHFTMEKNSSNKEFLGKTATEAVNFKEKMYPLPDKICNSLLNPIHDFNCFSASSSSTFVNFEEGGFTPHSHFIKLQRRGTLIIYEKMGDMPMNILCTLDKLEKIRTDQKPLDSSSSKSSKTSKPSNTSANISTNISTNTSANTSTNTSTLPTSTLYSRSPPLTSCIVCCENKLKEWESVLNKSDFKVLYLKNFQDFDLITFSFLHTEKSLLVCTVECFQFFAEELDLKLQDVRDGIESIIEQNSFVSLKEIPLQHKVGITYEHAKKIFWAQSFKFPYQSVPFQWITFNNVVYDICEQNCVTHSYENCIPEKNLFVFEIIKGKWNFVCLPIEGQAFTNKFNFYINPLLLSQIPSHIFFDDVHLKWNNYKFSNMFVLQLWSSYFFRENAIVIPVSMKISQKILPLQFYMHMNEEEQLFLNYLDHLYEFLYKKSNGYMSPNLNKIQTRDILIPHENSKFPLNMYKILEREKNKFSWDQAIENIENQTWKNKSIMQGNTIMDMFANWKFDKTLSSQTNYKNVFQNISQEQPDCYICFENEPVKFSVCGHGYCFECWEEYKKTERLNENAKGPCIFACPICRKELTCPYDWLHVTQNNNEVLEKIIVPSKFEKLKIQIKSQQETNKKILIIVPENNKNEFLKYLKPNLPDFEFLEFREYFLPREALSSDDTTETTENTDTTETATETDIRTMPEKWICLEEETFSFTSSVQIPMDIIYYLSPTLASFKMCYPFLLNQVLKRDFLMVMLSISNHTQEETQLLSIIETFFSF